MELIYLFLLLLVIAVAITLMHPVTRDRLFPQPQPVRVYSPRREARMLSSKLGTDAVQVEWKAVSMDGLKPAKLSADMIQAVEVKAPRVVRVDDPTPLFTQMLQSYRDRGIDIS